MLLKRYTKNRSQCKITFVLPPHIQAKSAYVVAEFHNWDMLSLPMIKDEDGKLTVTVTLEAGREYQFRYLVDGSEWHNDDQADNSRLLREKWLPA